MSGKGFRLIRTWLARSFQEAAEPALSGAWDGGAGTAERKARRRPSAHDMYGIAEQEFYDLARYNGEVSHGVMHTEQWQERMRELQRRFNDRQAELYR